MNRLIPPKVCSISASSWRAILPASAIVARREVRKSRTATSAAGRASSSMKVGGLRL